MRSPRVSATVGGSDGSVSSSQHGSRPPAKVHSHASSVSATTHSSSSGSSIDALIEASTIPVRDECNFFVHNKPFQFAPVSLFIFDETSTIRQICVWITKAPWFDFIILLVILANSITLALQDYGLDAIGDDMQPDPEKSLRNTISEQASPIFAALFTLEMVLKVIAMGFVLDHGSYLRDSWNWLDFIVVVSGLLTTVPGMPSISGLRTFRVLRPLRTIEILPGLKLLVIVLLNSLRQLINVVALMGFIFFSFGILGLQLWSGNLHTRCRLTPMPVHMSAVEAAGQYMDMTVLAVHSNDSAAQAYLANVVANRTAYPYCGVLEPDGGGAAFPLDDGAWTQASSPWSLPRDCVWPMDLESTRACSISGFGNHPCPEEQTCGSNYDAHGNERFRDAKIMRAATYTADRMWGIPNFDDILSSFMTILEVITLEGWSDIMYWVQDVYQGAVAAGYFVTLVLLGAFLMLNLTLAVIRGNLKSIQQMIQSASHTSMAITEAARLVQESVAARKPSKRRRNLQDTLKAFRRNGSGLMRDITTLIKATTARHIPHSDTDVLTLKSSPDLKPVTVADVAAVAHVKEYGGIGPGGVPVVPHRMMRRQPDSTPRAFASTNSIGSGGSLRNLHKASAGRPPLAPAPVTASIVEADRDWPDFEEGQETQFDDGAGAGSGLVSMPGGSLTFSTRQGGAFQLPRGGSARSLESLDERAALGQQDSERSLLESIPDSPTEVDSEGDVVSGDDEDDDHKVGDTATPSTNFTDDDDDTIGSDAVPNINALRVNTSRALGGQALVLNHVRAWQGLTPTSTIQRRVAASRAWDSLLGNLPALKANFNKGRTVHHHHPTTGSLNMHNVAIAYPNVAGNSCWMRMRQRLVIFVKHPWFGMFILLLICANTVVLGLDQHPMDPELQYILEIINFVLTLLFTLEVVLKVTALGAKRYLKDRFNKFDAFIVAVSLVELVVFPPTFIVEAEHAASGGAVSAFRTFRLFRVFSLARSWVSLRMLLRAIVQTLRDVGYFALLLVLFMYIFSILGMQFFANRFHFDPITNEPIGYNEPGYDAAYIPRANFDSLQAAIVCVFQVLTAENWNEVLHDGVRSTGFVAYFYFVTLVGIGNFIILNLFLAILLGNFEGLEMQTIKEKRRLALKKKSKRSWALIRSSYRHLVRLMDAVQFGDDESTSGNTTPVSTTTGGTPAPRRPSVVEATGTLNLMRQLRKRAGEVKNRPPAAVHPVTQLRGRSLFCLGPTNKFRVKVANLVRHPQFDNVVLVLIIISSILLAVDTPLLDPNDSITKALSYMDSVLAALFFLEMSVKIIAYGLVFQKNAYLRSFWNILDGFIVCVSILSILAQGDGAGSLRSFRSLRTLRALRPLRMISRNPGLKLVVNALFRAVPSILNVIFVCVLFFLIFGIVGVSYFKGKFMRCQGDVFDNLSSAQASLLMNPVPFAELTASQAAWAAQAGASYAAATSKDICLWLGASWEPTLPQSFDNLLDAAGALFEMSTTERWLNVMYAGIDATDIGMQPIRDHAPGWSWFFMAFMVVGSFFVMNLFVGVVIDNFNRMKEEMGENMFLTPAQREWVKTQESLLHVRPDAHHMAPSSSTVRRLVFELVESGAFEFFIMSCILLNTVVMAMAFFGQSTEYNNFLEAVNVVFAAIFTLEAGLKIYGLGLSQYWKDSWNKFDITIVLGTLVGLMLKWTGAVDIGAVATIIRIFRLGRIIRLVQSAKGLRALFNTLIVSLPSLGNIGGLLFLLFFIYAAMGVQLFAHVKFGDALNDHANFRSFGTAMLTLIRSSTGENWNQIMYDIAAPSGPCTTEPSWDDPIASGCGTVAAYFFFYSFTLLVAFVMLNVFIAVILEGFGDMSDAENALLTSRQLEDFAAAWAELDVRGTNLLPTSQLYTLLMMLPSPLGFADDADPPTMNQLRSYIESLALPTYGKKMVHFSDVLRSAARRAVQMDMATRGLVLEEVPESHGVHRKWERIKKRAAVQKSDYTAHHLLAAERIQDAFSVFQFRTKLRRIGKHGIKPVEVDVEDISRRRAAMREKARRSGGGSGRNTDALMSPPQDRSKRLSSAMQRMANASAASLLSQGSGSDTSPRSSRHSYKRNSSRSLASAI